MNGKTIVVLLLGLLVGYSAGCRAVGIEHVPGDEFQELVEAGQRANTAYWIQAIGATSSRAYLERGEMITSTGSPQIQVLWTRADELPEGYLDSWASLGAPGDGAPSPGIQNLLDKIKD